VARCECKRNRHAYSHLAQKSRNNQYERDEWVTISPSPGHYESPDLLVKQINAKIERVEYRKNLARFLYNDISKKITVRLDEKALSETIILKSKPTAELLGLQWETKTRQYRDVRPPKENNADNPGLTRKRRQVEDEIKDYLLLRAGESDMVAISPEDAFSYTASGVCDLQRGFYSLFIYCDVVEPVVVGDVKASLLALSTFQAKRVQQ
jgi:hypothetical protein